MSQQITTLRIRPPAWLAWLVLALVVLASAPVAAAAPRAPLVVVSLDGFRTEYLQRGLTPTLARLAREGVRARSMRPAFPPVTLPNHYTLVTGLTPEHHGIVDNGMVDPAMPGMRFGAAGGPIDDPRWWSQAEPLWLTAQAQGVRAAASLWPGAGVKGRAAADVQSRTPGLTSLDQARQALAWLDRPATERPGLILLHLVDADVAGHAAGPDSPEMRAAIVRLDQAMDALVRGLKARGLSAGVNLVVVSDHGMAATAPEHTIWLDDLIEVGHADVPAVGANAGIDPLPGHEAEIEKALLGRHGHMECARKQELPARLHYSANARIPAILCMADLGWLVRTRADLKANPKPVLGEHGYDPRLAQMQAIFIAHGPAFRRGAVIPAFDNVDVYPLLARLLAIRPRPNDGDIGPLRAALR